MIQHRYLVLLSTFICTFMFGGVSFGSPRMLVALMDTFRATRAEAGLILSIMMTFLCFTSLFSGVFLHRFGARATSAVGSLVLSVSFGVSFLATSVTFLVVTLGVFGGTGLAFLYAACTPTICDYFQGRSQTLAINFMASGGSFGGMSYSYIIGYITEQYGVRGTCLLIGGITLNATAMTLLWTANPDSNEANRANQELSNVAEHSPIKQHAASSISQTEQSSTSVAENQSNEQHTQREANSTEQASISVTEHQPINRHPPRNMDSAGPISFSKRGIQPMKHHSPPRDIDIIPVSLNATEPKTSPVHQTHASGSLKSLKDKFKSVFTDNNFLWFAFGNGLQMAVMSNARTYIVDTMLNKDQELKYGSLTVFLFSLFGLFGRLLFAATKLIPGCSSLDINLLSTVFGIIGFLLIALVGSVTVRLVAWCLNGIAMGIYLTSLSVTTAKLLGKEHVAIGTGLMLLIRGIGSTVGGPLNGHVRDMTGTYKVVFICTSLLLALGGVFVFIARLNRLRQRRADSTVQSNL